MKTSHRRKPQPAIPLTAPTRRFGLELPVEAEALPILEAFARAIALEAGFAQRQRLHIQLALEEIAVNILAHGCGPEATFKVLAFLEPAQLRLEVLDSGPPFAFEEALNRYKGEAHPDQPLGGIGLFLVKKFMDRVNYEPGTPQGNRMVLVKRMEKP